MTTRTRIGAIAAALAITVTSLTGCQWMSQQTTPSTPPQTPVSAATPAETAQERLMRLDQEAAEQAYRTAGEELNRLGMAGGATKPTKTLLATTAGQYLDVQMGDQRYLHEHGLRSDRPVRSWVVADGGWSETEIGLTACEDGSRVRLLRRDGKEVEKDRPRRLVQTVTATKISGRWKITKLEATKTVKTFESESGCEQGEQG